MTREETMIIVKKVHDLYSHQDKYVTSDIISSRVTCWDVYFKDFSFAVVDRCVDYYVKSHRDMPMPSDLLQLCKDERDLERQKAQNISDPENIKPTWLLIYEARNGSTDDKPIPEEVSQMTDQLIDILRADKKLRQKWLKESGQLPYEV